MSIANSVIVITGGGQGLGRTAAIYLASRGAQLALIDLNQDALDSSVQLCREAGGEARSYIANVAIEADVVHCFEQIVSDFDRLDAIVNNAGIIRDAMLIKAKDGVISSRMTLQQWQSVVDVNLTGVFLCGREAASKMVEQGDGGVIINIASISKAGNMGQSNYAAAKAGVEALTVTWAKELARYSIRAAAIAPGFMNTEMTAAMKPEAREMMTKAIPLRRMGQPENIAQTIAFILENDYISGRTLEIDGALRL